MKNKNSNVNVDFSQLKKKILDVINYSNELLENNSFDNMALLEDIILTEMNDLLMGIDSGNIVIPDYKLKLSSTYYITDGAITDKKLEQLLLIVQNEIYSIKDSIKYPKNYKIKDYIFSGLLGILVTPWFVFLVLSLVYGKTLHWILFVVMCLLILIDAIILIKIQNSIKKENYHNLFPNLPYEKCLYVCSDMFKDQDMFTVGFSNGYEIDLGYLEDDDIYVITIVKDHDWSNIIEEIEVKKRYDIAKTLKEKILEYENK